MALRDRVAALLGVSAFARAANLLGGLALDSEPLRRAREAFGGQLAPQPISRVRWYLRDLEAAEHQADTGDLATAAQMMRSARKDGIYAGVLSTRTGGLVRLPKVFRGRQDIIDRLDKKPDEARSVFDEMFPAAELSLLAADGIELGVGIAELVEVPGRDYPVLVRLDPEFLRYQWAENRWYYRSIFGMLPITPGDGRWVLHIPGGRMSPWQHGIWRAIGRAYIRKEHASFYRDNWQAKLANSARVAISPQGGSEQQKEDWFQQVAAWGLNTVFSITPGYDVKLLESNGRGYESFRQTIQDQNEEMTIAVAGQTVTTDGGAGFQNSDIFKSIRADLIKDTADSLAHTVNTQGLPVYIINNFGEDALDDGVTVEWNVTPPKDKNSEATALSAAAGAIKSLTEALASHGLSLDAKSVASLFGIPLQTAEEASRVAELSLPQTLDLASQNRLRPTQASVVELARRLGIELEEVPQGAEQPRRIELAPTDVAKVVRAIEARASQGLPPFGDERDNKTITELGESATAQGDIAVVEAEADATEEQTEEENAA